MLALADFRDVFEVLDRFDIALAQDWLRNSALHHTFWRKPLPAAFPMFNGGLIAVRRNPATADEFSYPLLEMANMRVELSDRIESGGGPVPGAAMRVWLMRAGSPSPYRPTTASPTDWPGLPRARARQDPAIAYLHLLDDQAR